MNMPSNIITVQPDSHSHLKVQRLAEELAIVRKKLNEYEDLFSTLYYNACGHCKEIFQEIGIGSAGPVLVSNLVVAKLPPSTFDSNDSPHASSSPTKPLWYRILKRPRLSLPESFSSRHMLTTATEAGSPQCTSSHGVPTKQIRLPTVPSSPKISTSQVKRGQTRYLVEFPDAPGKHTLQVKLERVWTHRSFVYSVRFSPHGKYLAVGVTDDGMESQKTYIYDAVIGRKICLFADPHGGRHPQLANYLSFSPGDGRYLATARSTGQTMIWHVREQRVRNAFGIHRVEETTSVDFSPNGRFVVSGSLYNSGVRIWSMRDGSSILLQDHDGTAFATRAVKFSPDGKHVLASDFHGTPKLWNVRSSKMVRKWKAHKNTVWSVAFTPNGRGLVTASDDSTLKYWDIGLSRSGDLREVELLKFVGHTTQVRSVAVSPDGRWVISGSDDRTARIWDMADASLQFSLLGHEHVVSSVDFSPTGNHVACGSWDGKVLIWRYESSKD